MDKNNTLGGQLTYQRENDRYNGESNNVMMQGENVYERLNSTLDSHSHYNQWQANMYYEGHIGTKWTINLMVIISEEKVQMTRVMKSLEL